MVEIGRDTGLGLKGCGAILSGPAGLRAMMFYIVRRIVVDVLVGQEAVNASNTFNFGGTVYNAKRFIGRK